MGVNTKALLIGKLDVVNLAKDLITEYGTDRHSVQVHFTHSDDYLQIVFDQKKPNTYREMSYTARQEWHRNNKRLMSVFYDCKSDYSEVTTDDVTYISLGTSGDAVEIMEALLKKYGGYIIRCDATDDWEKFII